ncbi:N-acetyltransferase, putative [Trypanosoma equiperdum]|uniref:N-acetyltransferase, putative n=3 Tax=Trypanozoon TaxID=39700 RepID=Q38FJ2_TRYB2|nr:N-acetyltransferase, putative [Trypanosoma brucei gambiense DAL972]XP_803640.1 N-acetyltransferase, putative [Trypanosoma brucei brucei TREU927]EAN76428.1 N-acetyltransferase, putative [Trypanosoma brucei brucei TREU927]CBH14093.1 N-acetyltransferase, putative [Trypanosoma brucei gambiense DAL972]SCU69835.1 N-acetyltransferase, putative [Trypanosoma equiperdum]|eukprot:XP_011776364.1 N-acetyltransferase, putative [Trypanosoma brucei gambiense DAL972]
MNRAARIIPPHRYRTADGEQFTIRHIRNRTAYNSEWVEVRERLVSGASLLPQVLDVASDSSLSVIFIAVGSEESAETGIMGYVVVNMSFIASKTVSVAWISVLNRFRGRHVGRSLLHHVDSFCRANMINHIEAMRTDGLTNLFKKCGFRLSASPVIFKSKAQRKDVQLPSQPQVPYCITSGAVTLRCTTAEDRKGWSLCILEACSYLSGCTELVVNAFSADFRVSAVNSETKRIIGIVSIDSTGWIPLIACLQEYRGQGLGSFMMFIAMEWLRRQGGSEVTLSPLNASVVNFYKRWSFVVDKKSAGKRKRCDDGIPILVRRLSEGERFLPDGYELEDFVHFASSKQNDTLRVAGSG